MGTGMGYIKLAQCRSEKRMHMAREAAHGVLFGHIIGIAIIGGERPFFAFQAFASTTAVGHAPLCSSACEGNPPRTSSTHAHCLGALHVAFHRRESL